MTNYSFGKEGGKEREGIGEEIDQYILSPTGHVVMAVGKFRNG